MRTRGHPLRSWLNAPLMFAVVLSARSQVIHEWTHQSDAALPSAGESSAAVGMDTNYMFVAENENEVLRLYRRFPTNPCAAAVYTFDAHPYLGLVKKNPEADIEAAVMVRRNDANRIYWLGSHSNSKNGKLRPNRYRLFATDVIGNGSGSSPYTLKYVGRYEHLRSDLIAWDQNNLHGQGTNHFRLGEAAAENIVPESDTGFNLEGLCLAPDGTTAYLAFRAPLPGARALVVPLLNLAQLVEGQPAPGKAKFGVPFTLDLGGRGIRSIDSNHPGHYLIVAGPAGDASNFRLYTWTGKPSDAPVERLANLPHAYHPEAAVPPAAPLTDDTVVQLISDDSAACWRSFTVRLGPAR